MAWRVVSIPEPTADHDRWLLELGALYWLTRSPDEPLMPFKVEAIANVLALCVRQGQLLVSHNDETGDVGGFVGWLRANDEADLKTWDIERLEALGPALKDGPVLKVCNLLAVERGFAYKAMRWFRLLPGVKQICGGSRNEWRIYRLPSMKPS